MAASTYWLNLFSTALPSGVGFYLWLLQVNGVSIPIMGIDFSFWE